MTAVDRSPARLSGWIATAAAALVALVATGRYAWLALGAGLAGFVVLVAGVAAGRRSGVTLGAAGLFAGVIVAGVEGAPGLVLLVATVATVLAWDVGTNAISVGAQLGRAAPTARIELVHASANAAVGTVAVGVGYGVYATASGGRPVTALVFLLLAAVCIASALR